jgi:high-affinity nickel-transport protein
MDALPREWLPLLAVVFALGARHGLDADHIAAIDGMTRFNSAHKPGLARRCGALFSLGHGMVVIAIALSVAAIAPSWSVPAGTEQVGAWVSIGVLAILGAMNIAAVVMAKPDEVVRPVGLKGRVFGRWQQAGNAWLVAGVGALFAVSFDTLSQAALFAVAGVHFGGAAQALALALAFTAGMLLVDGLNGVWMWRLVARADRTSRMASRAMGLFLGTLSLAVAAYGAARY